MMLSTACKCAIRFATLLAAVLNAQDANEIGHAPMRRFGPGAVFDDVQMMESTLALQIAKSSAAVRAAITVVAVAADWHLISTNQGICGKGDHAGTFACGTRVDRDYRHFNCKRAG